MEVLRGDSVLNGEKYVQKHSDHIGLLSPLGVSRPLQSPESDRRQHPLGPGA